MHKVLIVSRFGSPGQDLWVSCLRVCSARVGRSILWLVAKKPHGPQVCNGPGPSNVFLFFVTGNPDLAETAEIRIWRPGRFQTAFGSVRRRLDAPRLLLSGWERFGKGSERFGKGWERFFQIFSVFSKNSKISQWDPDSRRSC